MTLQDQLLADARYYSGRKWSCVPVKIDGDKKKPTVKWKRLQTTRPSDAELCEWFARPSIDGVGVITGPASGSLAIRDFDTVAGYHRWLDTNPTLGREIPTVRTQRGYHIWAESDLPKNRRLKDGEYRGLGLTVAPHSRRGGLHL